MLTDEQRAQRFLDLTGLTPDTLRESIATAATQRAVLDFLGAHEPDLIGAADALGISPERLAQAQAELGA